MTSIIIIDKNGIVNEKKVKTMDKLYTSCGYRTNKDFELLHIWNDVYELYGKKTGKPISQNKYELYLNTDFYGNLCIIKKDGSLSLNEWNIFYGTNEKNENENENDFITETDSEGSEEIELFNDNELTYDEYEEEL